MMRTPCSRADSWGGRVPGGRRLEAGFLVAALATAAACAQTPAPSPAALRAIAAGGVINAEGKITTPGLVVIDGERIVQVGGEVPAGAVVDHYPTALLCPGLIDCHAAIGALDGLSERNEPIQPRVRAADAFNRYSSELRAALAAGVTTFALAPDDQNLVGGQIAICQTTGPDGRPRLLTDAGPLKLSLAPETFKLDREPTSRSGALGVLRTKLDAARAAEPSDALGAFAQGRAPGILTAPTGADVLTALELAKKHELRLALIHSADARRVAELAAGHVLGVIIEPLDLSSGRRSATAAGVFEHAGVKVALAGGLPQTAPDSVRIGAAVAARGGLSLEAARRAITTVPAELLGVGDRVGELAAGRQADVVVFSGDPLDLRARVLAVYVAGRRVYAAAPEPAEGRP